MIDLTIKVAGEAGQGIQSISYVLGRLLTRSGYYVFADQDVMSRVRGGHNFARLRVRDAPVYGPWDRVNLLVALDRPSLGIHQGELVPGGVAVFDPGPTAPTGPADNHAPDETATPGVIPFPVPLEHLAREVGRNPVMTNAVALGAVMFLTGYPLEHLLAVLKDAFAGKTGAVIEANLECAQAGFDHARKFFRGSCPCAIDLPRGQERRLFLTGSEAIALGAICSGVKFHSGYPMSPSTAIMEYLAARGAELGIVVEQTEDEIAGINMALGASYAGVRAMTATSGGGFALMVEGLGWAGISETPIVIVLCSRPGPATGFPTRTEQADLLFALHAGQDEFPRFIFAPGTAEQAFYAMNRAFNLSQKYQVPALVLADQFLCDSYATIEDLDLARTRIEYFDANLKWQRSQSAYGYRRYSPGSDRVFPGVEKQVVVAAGHEHDEAGYITESAEDRSRMMERRMGRLEPMRQELDGITCFPEDDVELMLTGFGSTFGPTLEAVEILRADGIGAGMLHLSELSPLPARALLARVERTRRLVTVENNATAQLAQLLQAETRLHIRDSILKYDGRPFTAQEIADRVKGLT